MTTVENIAFWFIALTIVAGFWLVYGVVATETRRWRDQRAARMSEPHLITAWPNPPKTPQKCEISTFRGYDSPDLFRDDALERIQRLDAAK